MWRLCCGADGNGDGTGTGTSGRARDVTDQPGALRHGLGNRGSRQLSLLLETSSNGSHMCTGAFKRCVGICYAAQVIQLAFLVACMYTGVGLLRLGFMVRFLSHSVITGFTSGGGCQFYSSMLSQ